MSKRKNPETSKAAFSSLQPSEIKKTYDGILSTLSIIQDGTFEDIAKSMKCSRDKIWKRLSELEKYGMIFRPGIKRKLKSGREGYVWALTDSGKASSVLVDSSVTGKSISDYSKELFKKPHTQSLF